MLASNIRLYAILEGFRIQVLANRLGCTTEFSRSVHNKLLDHMEYLTADLAKARAAQSALDLNRDQAATSDLAETLYICNSRFAEYWCDPEPTPLVEYLWIDHATREWHDPRTERWHFLDGSEPEMVDVPDEELDGLRTIIDAIAAETGVHFSAYRVDFN